MNDKFEKATKILSLFLSLVALIVSSIALSVNRNNFELNKEKHSADTIENITISLGETDFKSFNLKFKENDERPSYRIKTNICFVNNSNLPIYINKEYIKRMQYSDGVGKVLTLIEIEDLDLPIAINPQETKFVDFHMKITIPQHINQYIIDEFGYTNDLEIEEVGTYLFFEKHTDLIGNEIILCSKDDKEYLKYNPTIPFELFFWTTRGTYFSTEFYEGLYLNTDIMIQKYNNFNMEISYGKPDKKEQVLNFLYDNSIVVLLALFGILFLEYIIMKKFKNKFVLNNKDKNENE